MAWCLMRGHGVGVRSVLALRCQAPASAFARDAPAVTPAPTCVVCGLPSHERCGKCKQATYCSREHQMLAWKKGHRAACGTAQAGDRLDVAEGVSAGTLFPEMMVVCEPEPDLEERNRIALESVGGAKAVTTDRDAHALADAMDKEEDTLTEAVDQEAIAFTARTSCEPDQCVRCVRVAATCTCTRLSFTPHVCVCRYCRWNGDAVLNACNVNCPPAEVDIPPCACGAPRKFEFQARRALFVWLPSMQHGTGCCCCCCRCRYCHSC